MFSFKLFPAVESANSENIKLIAKNIKYNFEMYNSTF